MKIDFVITWVDGSDSEWRKEKAKYDPTFNPDAGADRYRDMGFLKYWFRAVEKYAPWVNKVHFITWGHLPEWLNTEYEKLNIVKHEDYMLNEYLPTFSSRPLELNMCKIKNLCEHFVYFNDDMILNAPVKEEFFFQKGLPCDFAYSKNISANFVGEMYSVIQMNESCVVNKYYSYIKTFFKHPLKFVNIKYSLSANIKNILKLENFNVITGFEDLHLACPYIKSDMLKLWEKEAELFDSVSKNKFRTYSDVCQRVFRYMRLAEGRFYPVSKVSRGKVFRVENENKRLIQAIKDENIKMLCINDTPENINFDKVKEELIKVFDEKLPEKSNFEK